MMTLDDALRDVCRKFCGPKNAAEGIHDDACWTLRIVPDRLERAYQDGESSGYADWILALGEVLPDDVEILPTTVARWLSARLPMPL